MAKSINLTSFGLIRDADSDFSDDGTRFTCYKDPVTGAIVSKASMKNSNGTSEYFISYKLKLPNGFTRYFDEANGISINLTDLESYMKATNIISGEILKARKAFENLKNYEVRDFTDKEFDTYLNQCLAEDGNAYTICRDYEKLGFLPTEATYNKLSNRISHDRREARPVSRKDTIYQLEYMNNYARKVANSFNITTEHIYDSAECKAYSLHDETGVSLNIDSSIHDKEREALQNLANNFKSRYDELAKEYYAKAAEILNFTYSTKSE